MLYKVKDNEASVPDHAFAELKAAKSDGNFNITSWNQNRILVEVHIKTTGNNADKVQQKLDDIRIDFENSREIFLEGKL